LATLTCSEPFTAVVEIVTDDSSMLTPVRLHSNPAIETPDSALADGSRGSAQLRSTELTFVVVELQSAGRSALRAALQKAQTLKPTPRAVKVRVGLVRVPVGKARAVKKGDSY
jgi:hypothetical protein